MITQDHQERKLAGKAKNEQKVIQEEAKQQVTSRKSRSEVSPKKVQMN